MNNENNMMHYINIEKKRLCGRNNQTIPPLIVDYSTVENVEFTFINSNNQIQPLEAGLSGLYFAGSLKMGDMSSNLLFLSKDYTISGNVLTFNVDTYTQSYLQQIRKKNTEINIEIGQISLDTKQVLLRDYALANPRVYVAGLSPAEIESNDYYTKEEANELVAQSLDAAEEFASGLALELSGALNGKVDTSTFTEAVDNIENEISAVSGSIEGFATTEYVDAAVSGKASKDEVDTALENINGNISTLSGDVLGQAEDISEISGAVDALVIPTKVSELDNDSGFATSGYVNGQVSGKADQSALTAHTSDTEIHTTALEKAAWDAKQNAITADNKLDYALLSGTPTIPTKTSDLTNDSGFATSGYVDDGLALKQDIIDESNPISGNAVLVTYDPWTGDPEFTAEAAINMTHAEALQAQADAAQANADIQIVSGALDGKLDIPSGGTVGQVVTKTADGAEWADAQGGGDKIYVEPDYLTLTAVQPDTTVALNKASNNAYLSAVLEYSTDGVTWTNYTWDGTSGTVITLTNIGDYVKFRGDNKTFNGYAVYDDNGYRFSFSNSNNARGLIAATGNIMSLVDKTCQSLDIPCEGCFDHLFVGCQLISAPKLPALNLKSYCYRRLFRENRYISGTVELPAETPANTCYGQMFDQFATIDSVSIHLKTCNGMNNMFANNSKIKSIKVNFTNWVSQWTTNNWLNGASASGTFYCPYGLPIIRDASHIPAGWNVVYTDVPESVLSGISATEAALTMNND